MIEASKNKIKKMDVYTPANVAVECGLLIPDVN